MEDRDDRQRGPALSGRVSAHAIRPFVPADAEICAAIFDLPEDSWTPAYDAERRPVGEEVVGRTVRHARQSLGIGVDETDPDYILRREAQLLIDYGDSPIVGPDGPDDTDGLRAGLRAPDAAGLTRAAVTGSVRLFAVLDRRRHTTLLYADAGATAGDLPRLEALAAAAVDAAHGQMDVYLVADPAADVAGTELALIRDTAGEFADRYRPAPGATFVIRPDGYLCFAADTAPTGADLVSQLKLTFL